MPALATAALVAGATALHGYIYHQTRRIARDPHRYPVLRERERPPLLLRLGHFDTQAQRLEDLGFVDIGTMVEVLGMFRVASRIFYDLEHQTYAGVYSRLGIASLSFITELDDGRIVRTGNTRRPLVRYGRLYEQGMTATLRPKLDAHLLLVQRVKDRPGEGGSVLEPMGTMEHRLALARRYYVERFSAASDEAPSTF